MKAQVVICAAGMGTRLGQPLPKALVALDGEALLIHTLRVFAATKLFASAVVTAPESHAAEMRATIETAFPDFRCSITTGGATRQESVALALRALDADTELVAVHDAARPFVPAECIARGLQAAAQHGAATVAIPTVDTILVADAEGFLRETPDRAVLWQCQTPQLFRAALICEAHEYAARQQIAATDDASLVRLLGRPVKLVKGASRNRKITTPEDLAWARTVLQEGLD